MGKSMTGSEIKENFDQKTNKSYLDLQDELTRKLMIDYRNKNITHEQFIEISRGIGALLDFVTWKELNNYQ